MTEHGEIVETKSVRTNKLTQLRNPINAALRYSLLVYRYIYNGKYSQLLFRQVENKKIVKKVPSGIEPKF
jgi:hypothetical protein